jgi:hypothetical protein
VATAVFSNNEYSQEGTMSLFRPPDWQGNFSTGLWQLSYRIDDERTLIFFGGAWPSVAPGPEREWGIGLLRGKERDLAGEQRLADNPAFARQVTDGVIERCKFFVGREASIDAIVDVARETLAPEIHRAKGA